MVADAFEMTLIFSGLNKKVRRMFMEQDLIAPKKQKEKTCFDLDEVRRYKYCAQQAEPNFV